MTQKWCPNLNHPLYKKVYAGRYLCIYLSVGIQMSYDPRYTSGKKCRWSTLGKKETSLWWVVSKVIPYLKKNMSAILILWTNYRRWGIEEAKRFVFTLNQLKERQCPSLPHSSCPWIWWHHDGIWDINWKWRKKQFCSVRSLLILVCIVICMNEIFGLLKVKSFTKNYFHTKFVFQSTCGFYSCKYESDPL